MTKLTEEEIETARVVVDATTVYNLQLSKQELEGLADLLWCGATGGAITKLGLDDVLHLVIEHYDGNRARFAQIATWEPC